MRRTGWLIGRLLIVSWLCLAGLLMIPAPWAGASPANMTVSLSTAPTPPVPAGSPITYGVTVANAGSMASGTLTITLPVDFYVANSATCGTVPSCSVQTGYLPVACPVFPPSTNIAYCLSPSYITWTIASVAGGASGLELTAQGMSIGNGYSASASWLGDGCTTPGLITGSGVAGGCATNTVSYPGVGLLVTESSNEAGTSVFEPGNPVSPGQSITYTIDLDNDGDANSGIITLTALAPTVANYTVVPGTATCGSVAGCAVSVEPPGSCETGPCDLITWVISSIPAHTQALTLTFSATVNASATGSVVSQVEWNGSVSPPVPILSTSLYTSGDGCLYEPPPSTGCLEASLSNPVESPTPTPVTIPGVTTPHTGEPWAGSARLAAAIAGLGLSLMAVGYRRRKAGAKPTS